MTKDWKDPEDYTELWGAIRALERELETLRKSHVAHLSHSHGMVVRTPRSKAELDRPTIYVGIHEKIKHGQDTQGSATAVEDHHD